MTTDIEYLYNEKTINVLQTRTYGVNYDVDEAFIEDNDEVASSSVLNFGYPFFNQKKQLAGLPIIDWASIKN